MRLEGVRLNVKDGTPLWANIDQGLEESELMSPSGGVPALE